MTHGKSIKLFLVDGSINGILTAEIINWTGHVLSAPRTKLLDLIQREVICAELAGDFHLGYARQLTDKSSLLFDLAF